MASNHGDGHEDNPKPPPKTAITGDEAKKAVTLGAVRGATQGLIAGLVYGLIHTL